MSDSGYISSPRPMFEDTLLRKGVQRMKLGSTTAGVVLDVSKKGLTINGYYQSNITEGLFYACVREPVEITWEELEKVRKEANRRKPRKKKASKKTLDPTKIDKASKKYLDELPVVTINHKKYYLDTKLRERRPVDKPEQVYNY